ncbi:hypothetical protein F511_41121 [Dorcoceras hygrometricum]|uniref:Uncharacterized protein n=1 Tax=Dorcoceras hygrometricum TaxID=472368 RepID=A0A2Z7C3J3_9LAMI|nr:hypothetical protein F511_41121 [Dorcoceras hygrometricum]
MSWFERIIVRVISPTVHGVGYRSLPYDLLLAEQSSMQHNLVHHLLILTDHHQGHQVHFMDSFQVPSAVSDVFDVVGSAADDNNLGGSGFVVPYDASDGVYAPGLHTQQSFIDTQ